MKATLRLTIAAFGLAIFNVSAATLYVSLESTNPVPPYTNWATAANVIQDAVDAAQNGDTVLVTNGVYAVGKRDVSVVDSGQLVSAGPSRVAVTNSISLESVNGPLLTMIEGSQIIDEHGQVTRCVLLGARAVLSGFTLTNGAALPLFGNTYWWPAVNGGGVACASSDAIVTNCVLAGNSAESGGGASGGMLRDCRIVNNTAHYGGGADSSVLQDCTLSGNVGGHGGGVWRCVLYDCVVYSNWAMLCEGDGGGTMDSELYGCTVVDNWAAGEGGGAAGGGLCDCIVYYNWSESGPNWCEPNFAGVAIIPISFSYCCTTPLPTNGVGNIDADPRFVNAAAGDFRLRPDSPCVDAGTNLSDIIATDIVGEFRPWDGNGDGVAAFDMGAYEFRPSPVTLYVSLQSTNPVPPYISLATAATNIQDAVDVAKAGDTVLVTNGVYAVGSREISVLDTNLQPPQLVSGGLSRVVVTNSLRLESVNGPGLTTIAGICLTDEYGTVTNGVRCVSLGGNAILSGFTLTNGGATWNDIGEPGAWGDHPEARGAGVYALSANEVVTNCVLAGNKTGPSGWSLGGGVFSGTLHNCVLTNNSAWSGGGAYRCILYRCDLSGNSALGFEPIGGGASQCTLYNCSLNGNLAPWGGGGAWRCTLYNCIVTENSAGGGGGVSYSSLFNCVIADNSAQWLGGGAFESSLFNCILYYNTAQNYEESQLSYCCTTPLPTNGVGNITGPPLFMDLAAGDFRLWEGSPCIDAGTNVLGLPIMGFDDQWNWMPVAHITEPTDMLGNTRFIDGNGDGTVAWDIGAYEFNSFPPPRFTCAPQRMSDCWRLSITGAPNKWVHVQRSSDLKNWEDCWSGWMGSAGVKQVDDGEMTQKMMFYRVVVE